MIKAPCFKRKFHVRIYTTKINGVVCPPNISETVAGRLMNLAHRPRIASTMIKLISKPREGGSEGGREGGEG